MTRTEHEVEITDKLAANVGTDAQTVQAAYDSFYRWLVTKGKNPNRHKPLQERTAKNYVKRVDRIHRRILETNDPDDPLPITGHQADEYIHALDRDEITKRNGDPYDESSKRKNSNSIRAYFNWRLDAGHREHEWDPPVKFKDNRPTKPYRLEYDELGRLFKAAETYTALPEYQETPPDRRDRLSARVAQQLGIPKAEIGPAEWRRADRSTHIYSLVTVGYDAGLTPVEIAQAQPDWYDPHKQTLTIPREIACKQREKETAVLADVSAGALETWLEKRKQLSKYDDTSNLWLNQRGNPYDSGNLCYLIRRLCEEADIPTDGREIKWYSIRYTMGTNVKEEGDLSEANDQLRHLLEKSTKGYDKTPVPKLVKRVNTTHEKANKSAADPEYDPYAEPGDRQSTETVTGDFTSIGSTDVVTPTSDSTAHVDAEIPDTTKGRVDITRKILEDIDE
ncbi:integrase/recombinase XerC [Halalkaliarchaeum desulfuricum]|uniref:Integrase/recombinase XerC n=1 Tax=Halalkaliarchaeum desulfuricum TaxID=2055893 RepID=A0A343TL59_9EURY|nr:site-specific integrase [Halalkaliarchaeum desulfuricum]AUX09831.1 integrase/recombinase XerC [Halalkaliarchaeum desulfuricum]